MRRSRPELLLIAALAFGCKGSRGDTDSGGDPSGRCAAALTEWLDAALAEGAAVQPRPGVTLHRIDGPPRRVAPAPRLWLTSSGAAALDREPAADLEEALAQLPTGAGRLLVFADASTAWSAIVQLAAAAMARRLSIEFAVAARGAIEAPEHAVIEAIATSAPPASAPRPPPASVFDRCPAAREIADAADLARYAREIGPAIESCGCADATAARALMWHWLGRYSSEPIAAIAVELSETGAVLVLDGDTPWSKAVDSVRSLEGPVRLAVSPE